MFNIVKSATDVQFLTSVDRSARTVDGEILEFRPSCPFRSITDLKAFDDAEKPKGVSLTDPSQYEPLESILARCMRGEMAFSAEKGWFSIKGDADLDAVFDADEPVDDLTAIDDLAENIVSEINQKQSATHVADEQEKPSQTASESVPDDAA